VAFRVAAGGLLLLLVVRLLEPGGKITRGDLLRRQ
jgi:hypothetical protein